MTTEPRVLDDFPPNLPRAGDQHLYLKCVNVGMGDCSIVIMPNGETAVIDCGSSRREGVKPADIIGRMPTRYGHLRQVDLLVLSHPDQDHYNLVGAVIGSTYVDTVLHSMTAAKYAVLAFRRWFWQYADIGVTSDQSTVNATQPNELMILDGGKDAGGDEIKLFAVAGNVPSASRTESARRNTASIVVVCRNVTTGVNRFLIAADATCDTENFMLGGGRVGRIQNAQVMRVGHHGSDTSSRATFVNAVAPTHAAVVSSSQNNGNYCLPKESVVRRWMNKLPATLAANKTVGFWEDGAGHECSAAASPEEGAWLPGYHLGVPYDYDTVETKKPLWETFLDDTVTFTW